MSISVYTLVESLTETRRKQMAKKNAATERKAAAKSTEKQSKAPAKSTNKNVTRHEFRCLSKTVAQMFIYINGEPEKRALVDDMGFGGLSYLPNEYLNQRLLKQIYDRYDVHDNTIYSDAAAVKITTDKIGHALGLSSRGTPYDTKVAKNELSEEDKEKVFLLPNSTAKICPAALPTLFDLENTRNRNWAHHVHNFLLQELKKAKRKESATIHGCYYVLMIIYFHETQFGENSRDPAAQPPWLAYWTGENLKKRIKQERQHDVGLLKTSQLKAEKEQLKKKSTKKVPSSDSESQTEPEPPYSNSTDGEGDSMSNFDETISEQPPPLKEIRSKRGLNPRQQSSAFAGLPDPDNIRLADALKNLRKRKKEAMEIRKPKKGSAKGNKADETMHEVVRSASEPDAGSSDRTRMFDSFDTVSLGRDDITPTQPSQPSKPGNDNLETVVEVHHGAHHAEVVLPTETAVNTETVAEKENQDESTMLEMPKKQPPPVNTPVMQDVVDEEHQDEPTMVVMPEGEDPLPEDPEPYSLTLRAWLQPEAEGCAAKGLTDSPDAVITDVLLSMNQGGLGSTAQPTNDDNQDLGDQCRTPDPL
ncbi:hypothetical protein PIB30_091737 [Stylosanthes scabra]|uniref:Uncharacterized protein n=1 Tax=Stylosanthes scabra TaxID=79078 RepID=A0ABU6QUT0_9FABA|nr:hypothetical protein [Stylosanthes scabra]